MEATQDTGAFVMYSSALKRLAVKLSKICNDLRLLSSGPRTGINEINLPAMQPGSSIMPGKVNPVIPEVVNQIAFKVIGNDLTVTLAAEAGQLELNVMEPVIAQSLFESIEMLKNGMTTLQQRCVEGITANEDGVPAAGGAEHRPGDRAGAPPGLRDLLQPGQGSAGTRPGGLRTGAGEGAALQGGAGSVARPGKHGRPGERWLATRTAAGRNTAGSTRHSPDLPTSIDISLRIIAMYGIITL